MFQYLTEYGLIVTLLAYYYLKGDSLIEYSVSLTASDFFGISKTDYRVEVDNLYADGQQLEEVAIKQNIKATKRLVGKIRKDLSIAEIDLAQQFKGDYRLLINNKEVYTLERRLQGRKIYNRERGVLTLYQQAKERVYSPTFNIKSSDASQGYTKDR